MPVLKEVDVLDVSVHGAERIKESISDDVPVLIKGVDIGPCCEKWTPEYLMSQLRQEGTIHHSSSPVLSFIEKNFKYKRMSLAEMVSRAAGDEGGKYYLRSVGKDARVDPSDFMKDYPTISCDFRIPEFLSSDPEWEMHSSVLRISSKDLTLWTHYDVYDNILVQVRGEKCVILFPPHSVEHLYVVGDKSRIPEFNRTREELIKDFPMAANLSGYKATLREGDTLFIPNYWWHSVTSNTFSVSINIFWPSPHLSSLYDKKDVYGNKDPTPAAAAVASLERSMQSLRLLPDKYRKFYVLLLMGKLQQLE